MRANFRAELERNGRTRSIDVSARRYRDGAFVACIRVPARGGDSIHTVELTPADTRETRQLLAATASQLRASLAHGAQHRDVVGHTYDIIGMLAQPLPRSAPAVARGVPYGWDVVGDLFGTLRQAATSLPGALTSAGGAALGSLARGASVDDSARSALENFGASTGLAGAAQSAGAALAPILGYPADVRSPEELQARRDRALRELAIVAPTHSATDWSGAVTYHARNGGITGFRADGTGEADRLLRDRGELARLPQAHPALAASSPLRPVYTSAAGAAGSSMAVPAGAVIPAIRAEDLRAAASEPLPGVSSVARLPPEQAGAALGAAELLARALAQLAAESGGRDGAAVADAAHVARVALRSVDALAGARAGDPRARAAIRDAVNSTSNRIARALRVGLALVGDA